jgi:hypothetical protein
LIQVRYQAFNCLMITSDYLARRVRRKSGSMNLPIFIPELELSGNHRKTAKDLHRSVFTELIANGMLAPENAMEFLRTLGDNQSQDTLVECPIMATQKSVQFFEWPALRQPGQVVQIQIRREWNMHGRAEYPKRGTMRDRPLFAYPLEPKSPKYKQVQSLDKLHPNVI